MSDLWPAARAFEWPAAVGPVQIRPLESADGPALQELFDGLLDYEKAFGPPGEADAASTYVALPEGATYDDKLLLGLWGGGRLAGAIDVIIGYPDAASWSLGVFVVGEAWQGKGIGTAVLDWLASQARRAGADGLDLALLPSNLRGAVFARTHGFTESAATDRSDLVLLRLDLSGDRSHGRS